jgi:YfiH family protein
MNLKFRRIEFLGRHLNMAEDRDVALGFTEIDFPLAALSQYFRNFRIIQAKQVHSDIILFSDQISGESSGDGIILKNPHHLALIKTADCVPLYFWENDSMTGGVLHVGWRGLLQGIEIRLLEILEPNRIDKQKMTFFIGPSIESKCYPVGPELYEQFKSHPFGRQIFQREKSDRFHLDLKKGLTLSLIHAGIDPANIVDSEICNFCEADRFPSFRRDAGPKKRIFNFLLFKQNPKRI